MKIAMNEKPRVCVLSDYTLREFNPAVYFDGYEWEMIMPKKPLVEFFHQLHDTGKYDVYLNLCDGSDNQEYSYEGIDVIRALEEVNLPFTGADSRCYEPTREMMQEAAENCQIRFARGDCVSTVAEAEALSQSLEYPLMVKHPNSFGSTGMTKWSRVESLQSLKRQVKKICEKYGSARVEEFVDGCEFTVLVVDNPDDLNDPFVYPPADLIFPEGETFLTSNVKWRKWVYLKPVPAESLAANLMEMTRAVYLELGCVGYARSDIRMREDGELVMIEINPNPGILFKPEHYGPADVAMEYDPEGHDGFFKRAFRSAALRQEARMMQYSISIEGKSPSRKER